MIRRVIGAVLLPWAGYLAAELRPFSALGLGLAGTALVLWPRRKPTVSAYRERVRDLDERGWDIIERGGHEPPDTNRLASDSMRDLPPVVH